jgi:Uma2 family endonuclease
MSVLTDLVTPPGRLFTIADYAELGEDDRYRWELQEGNLVMSPSPSPDHMLASGELRDQLKTQLPGTVVVIQDVDIDLQLDRADRPGTSRRPDLIVIQRSEVTRVRAEGGILRASEVVLAIEIISPGSRRTDYVIKRAEYADAEIPHYWIVDLEPPEAVSLQAFRKIGDSSDYVDDGKAVTSYTAELPYPVTIDIAKISSSLA